MSEADTRETTRMDSLDVYDGGRVTIPADVRGKAELGGFAYVTLILHENDEEEFTKKMTERGRVRIPARLRDDHAIEDGDDVDLTLVH